MPAHPITDPRSARLAAAFEALRPDTLPDLLALYDEAARFKDPFNDVRGHAAMRAIFRHMFDTLEAPRFRVLSAVTEGARAVLTWDFTFQRQGGLLTIHGASVIDYGLDDRVTQHRDYWDPCEELLGKLPLLGGLVRWLQRRLAAPLHTK